MIGWQLPAGLAAALVLATVLLLLERSDHATTKAAWAAETASLAAQHSAEVARLEAVNREVVVQYIPKVEYVRGETRTVVKEVPVYVTEQDDRDCPSTLGLTRLHDRALGQDGVPPDPTPAGAADRPAAAPLSEIGRTLAGNYGACREYRLRAEALMDWARKVAHDPH